MTATKLFQEAKRLGLRLETRDDKLVVIPANRCPPNFADVLRQHKGELLVWLKTEASGLAPDEIPWLHVAWQILAGEFDGLMDNSVRDSLGIGLRSIAHPLCVRALARLNSRQ